MFSARHTRPIAVALSSGAFALAFAGSTAAQTQAKARPAQAPATRVAPATKPAAAPANVEPRSLVQKHSANGFEFEVGPTPAWVVAVAVPDTPRGNPGGQDRRILLADDQLRIAQGDSTMYRRVVETATSPAGLQAVAQLGVEFHPEYQKLTLHRIAVVRGGERLDRLKPSAVTMLRRETGLDKSIYTGVVTASVVLEDVRVGDIVEYEWTVTGQNPVFGGLYSGSWLLQRDVPVQALAIRLVNESPRPLQWRVLNSPLKPEETTTATGTELRLAASELRSGRWNDDSAPGWDLPFPILQVSQHADWSSVHAWAKGLFAEPAVLPPELRSVAERIMREHESPEARLLAALRWVQDEIRYFSISVGANSHRPATPEQVLARRYGDCKDKSLLLATLARALGIDAAPALVDTRSTKALASWLPGHQLFDHAIVAATIAGERFWLDPTISEQAGDLRSQAFMAYGKALVVGGTDAGLTDVLPPNGYVSEIATMNEFVVKQFGAPVTLRARTTYRGGMAQWVRAALKQSPEEQAAQLLDETYLRLYNESRRIGPLVRTDDTSKNELTLAAEYELPRFFDYSERRTLTAQFGVTLNELPMLSNPRTIDRVRAYALPYPARERATVTLQLPHAPTMTMPPATVEDLGGVAFRHVARYSAGKLVAEWEAEAKADHIPRERVAAYVDRLSKVRETLGRSVQFNVLNDAELADLRRVLAEVAPANRVSRMSPAERLQLQPQLGHRVVSRHIESGRLAGEVLGRAHLSRASTLTQMSKFDDAEREIAAAGRLLPKDGEVPLMAGELLLYRGRPAEALPLFEQAAALGPIQRGVEFARGQALYFSERFAEARDAFEKDLEQAPAGRRPYTLAWNGLAAARAGGDVAGVLSSGVRADAGSDWPRPILDYLAGDLTESALLAKTRDEDKQRELRRLCEAHFYIGQRALAKGDRTKARAHFATSADTGVLMYVEYQFSANELKRLTVQ
jgi:transglutaminase-like putative cysteine protease/lipoprotein NlpI